jgi:SHS2 domain-containing protein
MTEGRPRYESVDHTADAGIMVRARTLAGLFVNAAFGLFDTIANLDGVKPDHKRCIEAEGVDLEDLLVQWLSGLNFLFQTERILFSEFRVLRIAGSGIDSVRSGAGPPVTEGGVLRLEAEIFGQAFDPQQHEIRADVKAVTHHDLYIREGEAGWEARVIFDV